MARISQDNLDLFVASATDLSAKQHRDLMERCWFSLSKRKCLQTIEHQVGDSSVKIFSNEYGIATIFDQDMMIFLISQLMRAVNNNEEHGRRWRFTGYEYYKFIGRKSIGGKSYKDIWACLQRLRGTTIATNMRLENKEKAEEFSWLSSIKHYKENGKSRGCEVEIPDWIYDSVVNSKMVLTIDEDYFSIKGGLERWLYMFERKSTGRQHSSWSENTKSIYNKS